jgi:hypothetical protein
MGKEKMRVFENYNEKNNKNSKQITQYWFLHSAIKDVA